MTLIVEDGSVVAGANTYVSAADLTSFAAVRSITLTAGAETLLIQAMDYIETLNYKGLKKTLNQVLVWPRVDVWVDTYYVNSSTIPQQLKDGLCQTAIAIDQGTNPLQDQPRQTIREKVGDLEVEYSRNASAVIINKKILNTLQKLLAGGGGGQIKVSKA